MISVLLPVSVCAFIICYCSICYGSEFAAAVESVPLTYALHDTASSSSSYVSVLNASVPPCRFASLFTAENLLHDDQTQQAFLHAVITWESHFLGVDHCLPSGSHHSIGLSYPTMMTVDGHRLSVADGLLQSNGSRSFTAASKESLHLALIARVLSGDERAARLIDPQHPDLPSAIQTALHTLTVKINTYDVFNARYPGFGGFLPWVSVDLENDRQIHPLNGWELRVPSLDNGQLMWTAMLIADILTREYSHIIHIPLNINTSEVILTGPDSVSLVTPLYVRWSNLVDRYVQNALPVFYDGLGRFRAESMLISQTAEPRPDNFYTNHNCTRHCYLEDPYEGELFTMFAYLYSNWSAFTKDDRDSVWRYKRDFLTASELEVPGYPTITVQTGWWFSAHEQWKYLYVPYTASSINQRVFMNGEKARTLWSRSKQLNGMFASVNGLAASDADPIVYINDAGIPSLASQPVQHNVAFTLYSTMPLLLANLSVGLVWYHHMLLSNTRSQTCFGGIEAMNVSGVGVSPLKTWDSSMTAVLAMMGGVTQLTQDMMARQGVLRTFINVVDREWQRVFNHLHGEDSPFYLPSSDDVSTLHSPSFQPPFPSCTEQHTECHCQQSDHPPISITASAE